MPGRHQTAGSAHLGSQHLISSAKTKIAKSTPNAIAFDGEGNGKRMRAETADTAATTTDAVAIRNWGPRRSRSRFGVGTCRSEYSRHAIAMPHPTATVAIHVPRCRTAAMCGRRRTTHHCENGDHRRSVTIALLLARSFRSSDRNWAWASILLLTSANQACIVHARNHNQHRCHRA